MRDEQENQQFTFLDDLTDRLFLSRPSSPITESMKHWFYFFKSDNHTTIIYRNREAATDSSSLIKYN